MENAFLDKNLQVLYYTSEIAFGWNWDMFRAAESNRPATTQNLLD